MHDNRDYKYESCGVNSWYESQSKVAFAVIAMIMIMLSIYYSTSH